MEALKRRRRASVARALIVLVAAALTALLAVGHRAAAGSGQSEGPSDEAAGAAAQDGLDGPEGMPPLRAEAIIIRPDPADLRTAIWTDRARYRPGDRLRVSFFVSRPAYVYIYDLDTEGRVRLIFPNRYEMDNFVQAGTHTIPRRAYSFVVSGPPGAEYLQIIATLQPLKELAPPSSFERDAFPRLGDSAVEVKRRVEGMLRPAGRGWATAWTAFWVLGPLAVVPPAPTPPLPAPPPAPRRQDATLRVDSDPAGARVYVDGHYVGRTPLEMRVTPGWHTVRLRLEDYPDREIRIYVEPGEFERVEVRWSPEEKESKPPPGFVDRGGGGAPREAPGPPAAPSPAAGPGTSPVARAGLSAGVDPGGMWSLGIEGGTARWALGTSARFTGPFLPGETRDVEPRPTDPRPVPNGPEWEVYLKLSSPPLRGVSIEASAGIAFQPRGAVDGNALWPAGSEARPVGAVTLQPHWYALPVEVHATWSVGARIDGERWYFGLALHNRRGLVGAAGLKF